MYPPKKEIKHNSKWYLASTTKGEKKITSLPRCFSSKNKGKTRKMKKTNKQNTLILYVTFTFHEMHTRLSSAYVHAFQCFMSIFFHFICIDITHLNGGN